MLFTSVVSKETTSYVTVYVLRHKVLKVSNSYKNHDKMRPGRRAVFRLRKNLKGLLVVHPTLWLRTIVLMTRPFIRYHLSCLAETVLSNLPQKQPFLWLCRWVISLPVQQHLRCGI